MVCELTNDNLEFRYLLPVLIRRRVDRNPYGLSVPFHTDGKSMIRWTEYSTVTPRQCCPMATCKKSAGQPQMSGRNSSAKHNDEYFAHTSTNNGQQHGRGHLLMCVIREPRKRTQAMARLGHCNIEHCLKCLQFSVKRDRNIISCHLHRMLHHKYFMKFWVHYKSTCASPNRRSINALYTWKKAVITCCNNKALFWNPSLHIFQPSTSPYYCNL